MLNSRRPGTASVLTGCERIRCCLMNSRKEALKKRLVVKSSAAMARTITARPIAWQEATVSRRLHGNVLPVRRCYDQHPACWINPPAPGKVSSDKASCTCRSGYGGIVTVKWRSSKAVEHWKPGAVIHHIEKLLNSSHKTAALRTVSTCCRRARHG